MTETSITLRKRALALNDLLLRSVLKELDPVTCDLAWVEEAVQKWRRIGNLFIFRTAALDAQERYINNWDCGND